MKNNVDRKRWIRGRPGVPPGLGACRRSITSLLNTPPSHELNRPVFCLSWKKAMFRHLGWQSVVSRHAAEPGSVTAWFDLMA